MDSSSPSTTIPKKPEYKLSEVARYRLAGYANVKTLKKLIMSGELGGTDKAPPGSAYSDIWITAAELDRFKKRKGRSAFDSLKERSKKFSSAASTRAAKRREKAAPTVEEKAPRKRIVRKK